MSDYLQIHRLIRIIQILSSGRKITTNELLKRFEGKVSRRTLQRDLLTLSDANIPVISEKIRANENVWYLDSRFHSFIPIPIGVNEYLAAHILKDNLKVFRQTPFEKEIQSLIEKIDQIVPEEVFLETKATDLGRFFENYAVGIFEYSNFGEIIDNLIKAILHHVKCLVTYYSPEVNKPKTYYIEPEKMVYYNGGLYVIVYIRRFKKFILLAIQRIKKLKLLDEQFPDDHKFKEKDFWSGRFGLFTGELVNVKLRFAKEIRYHIEGRQWHSSQKFEDDENGNLILNMKVGSTPELITWILGWRYYIRVLEPDELVKEIKENIEKMRKKY